MRVVLGVVVVVVLTCGLILAVAACQPAMKESPVTEDPLVLRQRAHGLKRYLIEPMPVIDKESWTYPQDAAQAVAARGEE